MFIVCFMQLTALMPKKQISFLYQLKNMERRTIGHFLNKTARAPLAQILK